MSQPVYLLTGAPGTGKSTMLNKLKNSGMLHLIDPLEAIEQWTPPSGEVMAVGFDHVTAHNCTDQIREAWRWCVRTGTKLIISLNTRTDLGMDEVMKDAIEIHLIGAPYEGYVQIVMNEKTIEYSAEEFAGLAFSALV